MNQRTFLSIEPQIIGPMKSDLGGYTNPTFITNLVLMSKEMTRGLDLQVGVYNLFGEYARMPRGFLHAQPTLDYPHTQVMLSVTYRF